jgi:hypothetical protein
MVIFVSVIVIASCADRSQNRKIQEAAEVHIRVMERHDTLYAKLEREKGRIEKLLAEERREDRVKVYESMLRSIKKGFRLLESWDESVVGVPGMEREHHHHEGHSHDHSHDHNSDKILSQMSDQEILDLQKAYELKLDEVSNKIHEMLTTIKMYDPNAQ